ncbi:sporulation peptidase YabG [Paenibacillus thiaminolyticus]|uniref:sporulation peptidase YabG n=1 Tax=Paenibacillus thiaminolyticus TaxID=49283 RepID=UPI002542C2D4|nr:sporulation peptidase YabG [Paenibacillus thiaminolyticus]WII37663.1 sporulation peptidase YabG [Paenibacillus thiaminolyticus]
MKLGDLVVRKSYGGDITFRVETVQQDEAIIKGTDYRLIADSPLHDLVRVPESTIKRRTRQAHIKMLQSVEALEEKNKRQQAEISMADPVNSSAYFEMPGKVLHLDGDPNYLQKSLAIYRQLRVPAEGHYVSEANMADALYRLLPVVQPDIVVLTGHDGVLKQRKHHDLYNLQSYKNSQNFVNAVHIARQFERHLDLMTIVAGACQSHFEALLQAGANFASSPARIMIHALDPVYVAVRASYTSVKDTVKIGEISPHTMSGIDGLGGIETRGSYRIGMPKWKDLSTLKVTPSVI